MSATIKFVETGTVDRIPASNHSDQVKAGKNKDRTDMIAVKSTPRRRGVTLVEMLVVVALVVLMMTILVQIFQVATGAISVSRTYQELSNNLRMLDQTLRADLSGVTARLTPPLDPNDKLGYFEYGENSPADLQGEDIDDYLAFTTKAPEGQYFSGRVWIQPTNGFQGIQPITVTSQFAEVIYFLRNGNLYRRVLLVAPTRRDSLSGAPIGTRYFPGTLFNLSATQMTVSWQGMNDISARPAVGKGTTPIPNDLGDLTDRHNRAFRPRFSDDYYDTDPASSTVGTYQPDGSADDNNADDIPDYYPTLYPNLLASSGWVPFNESQVLTPYPSSAGRVLSQLGNATDAYGILPFPFISPLMFSKPDHSTVNTANSSGVSNHLLGWIHSPDPTGKTFNHAPLLEGDTLTTPPALPPNSLQHSTWFGFPTWRETMTGLHNSLPGWTDPVQSANRNGTNGFAQPWGLRPFPPATDPASSGLLNNFPPASQPFASIPGWWNDTIASSNFNPDGHLPYRVVWEDDLIMTGVRSFDVKAYDPDAGLYSRTGLNPPQIYNGGFVDLGYAGSTKELATGKNWLAAGYPTSLMAMDNSNDSRRGTIPSQPFFPLQDSNFNPIGFGHEGRIPPLVADNRVNPSRPYRNVRLPSAPFPFEPNNVGDDSSSVIRLRRVWDSWSTTYTRAPSSDINFNGSEFASFPNDLPIYPSYPAPYPSPLRGIQVQIRVVDPRDERIKTLTIRHDFSDKL